jgi:hypothetical protein
MNRISWFAILYFTILPVSAQNITGKVFDGNSSEPLSFANVVLLELQDSSFIIGTATDKNGCFSLQAEDGNYLLKITYIGYQGQIFPLKGKNVGVIYLLPDTQNLSEVTVTASQPIIKMEKGGISANVQNSPLRDRGTALDVLGQLPFVNADKNKITVFGKGTPLIYINNRLIRDLSELESLNSNIIKKATVITNPGAEYNAAVKSVIKIETLKPAGEGLSGSVMGTAIVNREFSYNSFVNLNYRKNKLDVFGLIYYYHGKDLQNIDWEQSIVTNNKTSSVIELNKKYTNLKSIRTNFGANYVFNNNHSMGMRYEYGRYPMNNSILNSSLSVFQNDEKINDLKSLQNRNEERTNHYMNAYYLGEIFPRTTMKLDMDFVKRKQLNRQLVTNTNEEMKENIATNGSQQSSLVASKLVFSSSLGKDNLSYGGEFARTNNEQFFFVSEQDQTQNLESNNNVAKQNLLATFITYSKNMNCFSIDAGLRFEHVGFDYFVNNVRQKEQSMIYNDWFPNINLDYTNNEDFQLMMGFSKSIQRPSYYQLRNNIQYNNRYAYETGNPFLRPSIDNNFFSSIKWKNLLINVNYDIYKDAIMLVSGPYTEEILISKPENFENFKNLSFVVLYSAAIDFWRPSLEIGFNKNFFNYGTPKISYNKPIYNIRFKNNFLLYRNLQVGADILYSTGGHSEIDYMYPVFRMNVYLSKTFMNDKLRVNLRGDDILGTDRYKTLREINNVSLSVLNDLNKQSISLSISYNLNTAKSKYKGEQASKELNRL